MIIIIIILSIFNLICNLYFLFIKDKLYYQYYNNRIELWRYTYKGFEGSFSDMIYSINIKPWKK